MKLYISASEIEQFQTCNRKWAFRYLEGIEVPPNASAQLGSRVHKVLEDWLRLAKAPDMKTKEGEIAASSLHLLPPPGTPGLEIEQQFAFSSGSVWYTGFKDYVLPGVIGDHKTTSNLKWAKTPEQILYHPQGPIYGADALFKTGLSTIEFRWNYIQTTGTRKAVPVWFQASRGHIEDRFFGHIDPLAVTIEEIRREHPKATELAPNFDACKAYGGCPYLSICNPKASERMQAYMSQQNQPSFLSYLQQQGAQQPAPAFPGVNAPNQAPQQQAPQQGWGQPIPGAMPGGGSPEGQPGFPQNQQPHPGAQPGSTFAGVPQSQLPQAWGGPPQQPAPQAPPAFPPAPQNSGVPLQQPAPAPFTPPARVDAPPANGGKKGRGKGKAAVDLGAAPGTAPAPGSSSEGFDLYIDCLPLGEDVTQAADLCNAAATMAAQQAQVPHYALIEYGKGPGFLQTCLAQILEKNASQLDGMNVVLSTSSRLEADCLPVLKSAAGRVVVRL